MFLSLSLSFSLSLAPSLSLLSLEDICVLSQTPVQFTGEQVPTTSMERMLSQVASNVHGLVFRNGLF